jgi:hypothetical protein
MCIFDICEEMYLQKKKLFSKAKEKTPFKFENIPGIPIVFV